MGFVVDAGGVYLLGAAGMDPYTARICSIISALFATWIYHRTITFHPAGDGLLKELFRYYASNALGAAVNYGIYGTWLAVFKPQSLLPPLIAASIAALAVNYLLARSFVFRARRRMESFRKDR